MTKLLVAKIKHNDGTEGTIKTYAEEGENPKKVLKDIIPLDAKIVSYEWVDTLTETREKWNQEHPDCPIPLDA